MKRLIIFFLAVLLIQSKNFSQPRDITHDSTAYLLIFSPDVKNESYEKQLNLLSKDPLGIDERNLQILEIFPAGGLEADGTSMDDDRVEKLRTDYNVQNNEFRIVLIDGKGKARFNKSEVANTRELFNLLDNNGGD